MRIDERKIYNKFVYKTKKNNNSTQVEKLNNSLQLRIKKINKQTRQIVSMSSFQPKKLLLIFELSNTLLHIRNVKSRSFTPPPNKPITFHQSILNDAYKISYRKGRQQMLDYFFKQEEKSIDIAIWTNLNHQFTQLIVKKYFSRYFRHLLFVMATDRTLYGAHKQLETNIRIKKELQRVYSNFNGYNEGNTLVVSGNQNLIEEHRRNDVMVPQYSPLNPMFEADPGMHPFIKYMRGVLETQRTHNLADIRTMIAAKNMLSMFKRYSHNMYSQREYS